MTLAKYLAKRSKEICADNGCTEDNHNCCVSSSPELLALAHKCLKEHGASANDVTVKQLRDRLRELADMAAQIRAKAEGRTP